MKNIIVIVLMLLMLNTISYSQNVHEFGLQLYSVNDFGLTYKRGSETSLLRFSGIHIGHYSSERNDGQEERIDSGSGFGFSIGMEKRRLLHKNLRFVQGPEVGFQYIQRSAYTDNDPAFNFEVYSPHIGYILGLNYYLSEKFYLSAELIPSIRFAHTINYGHGRGKANELLLGMSSTSALLTFAYRVFK